MLGQLHDPDLHLLRLFVTVVEAGGFSAAQGVLGLSQPSISQQMGRLETRLGYRLCSRGKGGFRLTEKASCCSRLPGSCWSRSSSSVSRQMM